MSFSCGQSVGTALTGGRGSRGFRSVSDVPSFLALGVPKVGLVEDYPCLTANDINACFEEADVRRPRVPFSVNRP